MIRFTKNALWKCLAFFLSTGAKWIRRCPSGSGVAAWRAVHFSYSHFGEDLIILQLLKKNQRLPRGIFVDIGAFDPVLHSNTYLLYINGWNGINIDASPSRIDAFSKSRTNDTNINAAVSDDARNILFLEYPTPGTSRIVAEEATELKNAAGEDPCSQTPMYTQSIARILHDCVDDATSIDFLNVDCEGIDIDVLRGWDWKHNHPRVIAIEANTDAEREVVEEFLNNKGYRLVARCVVTLIFALPETCGLLPAPPDTTAD